MVLTIIKDSPKITSDYRFSSKNSSHVGQIMPIRPTEWRITFKAKGMKLNMAMLELMRIHVPSSKLMVLNCHKDVNNQHQKAFGHHHHYHSELQVCALIYIQIQFLHNQKITIFFAFPEKSSRDVQLFPKIQPSFSRFLSFTQSRESFILKAL